MVQMKEVSFSILMPTYNQAPYIRRAILSVLSQVYSNWELIIINDGCTDQTEEYIKDYLVDARISYLKNEKNRGLGCALNQGIDSARSDYIAYLPSDDYYYPDHLEMLAEGFKSADEAILIHTDARSEVIDSFGGQYIKNGASEGIFHEHGLQLVQTAHRKTTDRWTTRDEFVTADLFRMFWFKLFDRGEFFYINEESCCWSIHPFQRHKLINDFLGGSIHKYKHFYKVDAPIKIYLNKAKCVDEMELYKNFRDAKQLAESGLKILIVGELSYNHDRIYAFEEHGHQLYGLWEGNVASWTNTGPLPFGNVVNVPYENWKNHVIQIKPDIIYAQLNHGAVNLAHEVLMADLNIPFVWHFNEGPSVCIRNGYWDKLIELYDKADGKIFINSEIRDWYRQFIAFKNNEVCYILDGDLAKIDYFTDEVSAKLSSLDGSIHTVVAGRMIGISFEWISRLSECGIHIHAYSGNGASFNQEAKRIAPNHFHVHPFCEPKKWTKELSKYDAGWLHCIQSKNNNNLMHANWDDFNLPCRMSTYAAARLPMIQLKNDGHIVAVRNYIKQKQVGIFFDSCDDLIHQLHDKNLMTTLSENMREAKLTFSFDYHVEGLIEFFRKVIQKKKKETA